MPANDPACENLCTAIARKKITPFNALGLCDYPVPGPITDVVVTGCSINPLINLEEVSADTLLLGVGVSVTFDYTDPLADDPTSQASCVCNPEGQENVWFQLTVVDEEQTIGPLVEIVLDCGARDAGYDPELGVWEFIVNVTGRVTAWGCDSQVVSVQLCPSADTQGDQRDPVGEPRNTPTVLRLRLAADHHTVRTQDAGD
jgi:hypothetical protein